MPLFSQPPWPGEEQLQPPQELQWERLQPQVDVVPAEAEEPEEAEAVLARPVQPQVEVVAGPVQPDVELVPSEVEESEEVEAVPAGPVPEAAT